MGDEDVKEPFTLYRIKPEIKCTTEIIDELTRKIEYVHNMEGKTLLVRSGAALDQEGGPLAQWTAAVIPEPYFYCMGPYDGFRRSYLYKEQRCGGLEMAKREGKGFFFVEEYKGNPNWGSEFGLSQNIWLSICSYLPIDKIFILSGMNKRMRQMIHGRNEVVMDEEGRKFFRFRKGIDWRRYMNNLVFKEITPAFPHSLNAKNGSSKLNKSSLVKWGHYSENTMRTKLSPIAQADPREEFLGDLLTDENTGLIFVHVGDNAFVLPLNVTSLVTPEWMEIELRDHPRFGKIPKDAILEYMVQAPSKDQMMRMEDHQFDLMGLDRPSRQPDGSINGYCNLPLHDSIIPWRSGVPLKSYEAREHIRVRVRVYVRRYFKDNSSETHKTTIIDRFTSKNYCKHCYRKMFGGSGYFRGTPAKWMELHADLDPICIHCFTHLHRDNILTKKTLPKGKKMPSTCPKCHGVLTFGRHDPANAGLNQKTGDLDYYQCSSCENAPKLWCSFVKTPIVYEPIWKFWRSEVTGNESQLPDIVKRFNEKKKRRHIDSLKKKIKRHKLEIEKDEAELKELFNDDEDEDDDDLFRAPEPVVPKKRPRKPSKTGKKPLAPGKKPRMSPMMTMVVNLDDEDEEEDDDDDFDVEDLDEDEDGEYDGEEDGFNVFQADNIFRKIDLGDDSLKFF